MCMPRKGDINKKFGVYESLCCKAEIVIPENVTFPGCAEHIHPDTQWRLIAGSDAVQMGQLVPRRNRADASSGTPD